MTTRIIQGDCRDVLRTLPDASVHACITSPPYYALRSYLPDGHADKHRELGLESSPDAYIAEMVAVFREVRRVMRPDAVAFVNVGDSYAGSNTVGWRPGNPDKNGGNSNRDGVGAVAGLAPKQLLMMPARLALALQADGWWVRSDIIWHKPNPMPESVTDRPTSAHEHVFLLSRSARYFYDAAAVAEPTNWPEGSWGKSHKVYHTDAGPMRNGGQWQGGATRSCRNVWTIATEAYSEAHFATFPTELASRCIRAGTSERGCCAKCGAPWVRQTDARFIPQQDVSLERGMKGAAGQKPMDASNGWDGVPRGTTQRTTTGWSPSCQCNSEVVPCTVLDPFCGASTTLLVAQRLQRDAIGIELSPQYVEMSRRRLEEDAGLFADVADAPLFVRDAADDAYDQPLRDLFAEAAD